MFFNQTIDETLIWQDAILRNVMRVSDSNEFDAAR